MILSVRNCKNSPYPAWWLCQIAIWRFE